MTFNEKVDLFMKENNYKDLKQLAIDCDIPYTTLRDFYKKESADNSRLSTIRKLATFMNCSMDYLTYNELTEPSQVKIDGMSVFLLDASNNENKFEFQNDNNLDCELNKIISTVIKEKRLKKSYSLEELANKLNNNITQQSLHKYENNEARMKNNTFYQICLALDENPTEVWEEINARFLKKTLLDQTDEQIQEFNFGDVKVTLSKDGQITDEDFTEINKFLLQQKILNESKKD